MHTIKTIRFAALGRVQMGCLAVDLNQRNLVVAKLSRSNEVEHVLASTYESVFEGVAACCNDATQGLGARSPSPVGYLNVRQDVAVQT